MKAMVCDGTGGFRLDEVPVPRPGPGQLAIRVRYAGVQFGDVLTRRGILPMPPTRAAGFEAAGVVEATGLGVDSARVGEPVVALATGGAFAETLVAHEALTLPAGALPLRTAAGFGWSTPTAYDLVHTAGRVRRPDSVLVHAAAGGVGVMVAQYARLAGAARVVGAVGSAAKARFALSHGYDEVLTWDELAEWDGEGFDVVLDSVGGTAREHSLDRLKPFGRLVVFGNAAGTGGTVNPDLLTARGQTMIGYNSVLLSNTDPARLAASARRALDEVIQGRVRLDITAEYPLADLDRAVNDLESRTSMGKIVVRVTEE